MATIESVRRSMSATSWLGVGVVGLAVFLLGIYRPALARFPYSADLQIAVAILGGAITVVGLSFWWDSRAEEIKHPPQRPLKGRAKEIGIAPSFEVYRPEPVVRPPARGEAHPDEDD